MECVEKICLSPQEQADDFLLTEKHLASMYNAFLLEAATPEVRRSLSELLMDTHSMQELLFCEMTKRGWYNVTKADSLQVDNAKQKYGNTVCR